MDPISAASKLEFHVRGAILQTRFFTMQSFNWEPIEISKLRVPKKRGLKTFVSVFSKCSNQDVSLFAWWPNLVDVRGIKVDSFPNLFLHTTTTRQKWKETGNNIKERPKMNFMFTSLDTVCFSFGILRQISTCIEEHCHTTKTGFQLFSGFVFHRKAMNFTSFCLWFSRY